MLINPLRAFLNRAFPLASARSSRRRNRPAVSRMSGVPAQLETLEPRRMLTVTPVLAGTLTLAYTELHAPMPIDPAITVAYTGHTTLTSATVKLTADTANATQDVLGFVAAPATMGNIMGSFTSATGLMTLTSAGGTATLANFQAALRAVTFSNTSHNPSTTARSVAFVVSGGAVASNTLTNSITVAAVNDKPVLGPTTVPVALAYVKNQAATAIYPTITVSDVDSPKLKSATVTITNRISTEDVLGFVANTTATVNNTGNIVGTFVASTGVMTLTSAGSTATLAQFQAALRAVTYKNSATGANPTTTPRSIAFQVNDGSTLNNLSNILARQITISYKPPVLAVTSALTYNVNQLGNQAATAINAAITVANGVGAANTKPFSATVKFVVPSVGVTAFTAGVDVLSYTKPASPIDTGNIVGSYSATTGVLTLTSAGNTATLLEFQNALRAVKYQNTSATPAVLSRAVQFQIHDAATASALTDSNIITSTITIHVTTFDGAYTGHFFAADGTSLPSVSYFGIPYQLTSDQSIIASTITNGVGTVTLPNLGGSVTIGGSGAGSGSLKSDGTLDFTTTGNVDGFTLTIKFTGKLTLNSTTHVVTGTGTWTIIDPSHTFAGNGKWTVTRPAH